jgi:hypothetical protein
VYLHLYAQRRGDCSGQSWQRHLRRPSNQSSKRKAFRQHAHTLVCPRPWLKKPSRLDTDGWLKETKKCRSHRFLLVGHKEAHHRSGWHPIPIQSQPGTGFAQPRHPPITRTSVSPTFRFGCCASVNLPITWGAAPWAFLTCRGSFWNIWRFNAVHISSISVVWGVLSDYFV